MEKIVELINTLYEKKMIISVNDKLNELKLWYTNDQLADHLGISKSSLEKITPNVTPSDHISSKIEAFFEQHCLRNQTMVNVAQLHEFADQHQSVLMVSTPDGYQPILQIFHKLPRTIYELGTPDFKIRCSEDHLVETVDGWVLANSVQIGQPVVTKHGLQPITIKDKQGCEKVYDFEVGHDNHRYWSNGISSHNSGKSFVASNMMREAQKEINAFVLAVDSENALDNDFVSKIGVDVSEENYMCIGVITIAHVKKVVSEFINRYKETNETRPVMIVIDSLGMLLTDTEFKHLEEGETKGDQGQRAKQLKALLRGFVQSIKKLNIQMIITDQVYAANQDAILAGLNDGLWVVNGAVKYSLSNVLLLTKLRLKDGATVTGINMKVEAIKTRFTKPFQKVAVEVPYETGMNACSGLLEVMKELKIVTQSGAWYYFFKDQPNQIQFRGKDFETKYLELALEEAAKLTNVSLGGSISEDDEVVEKDSSAQAKRIKNYMEFMDKNPDYVPEGNDSDLETAE